MWQLYILLEDSSVYERTLHGSFGHYVYVWQELHRNTPGTHFFCNFLETVPVACCVATGKSYLLIIPAVSVLEKWSPIVC